MSQPLSDYFAQEAGEFLDRMDALLARPEDPDPAEFFRLARGVRGSAQIVGAPRVASVAERLEDGARSLRDGILAWSDEVRERVRATAADLRALISAQESWGPAEDERASAAAARWEGVGSARRGGEPPRSGDQLFDFLRREITGVVGEMDVALAGLAEDPTVREPLRVVLRRMRPVRGVAGMDSLGPVLEALEGIEDAAHEVLGRGGPAGGRQLELLTAGRDALRAAGEALARGESLDETPELLAFRDLRDRAEGEEDAAGDGVVPVSRLFYSDAGPHVVSSPLAPAAGEAGEGTAAGDVESFLRIEGTGFLDRAEGLLAGLAQRPARFARIARKLADLAAGVGDLAVTYGMTVISAAADEAVERLGSSASAEEARAALRRLRASLPGAAPLAEVAVDVDP
ncbi:MAG TPA: Hpt domain-containing protein, partial [Longimicrobiaceae bacterium]|nr:Hpt domain-containing protein [Longimicrobiaceae bacterium]